MKFDGSIYKEITWFNASEIVEHDTFDGIGGVIAYHDCYMQGVDTRLEKDIADYLSAHNLKLAA